MLGLFRGTSLALLLGLTLVSTGSPAHEGEEENAETPLILGVLDFPTSGAAAARDPFERGVMLLHSFEFDDARTAFLEAQEVDPGFAMAIWGEALTLNHPLWAQQDRDSALEVLAKLPAPDQRSLTEREERYLAAVQILYGEGSKQERDIAYMDAMRDMYMDYPDDLEAASLYALSILGSVYERDFRTYMRAAAVAEEVFAKQPRHPGAAHYLIHSYDDQIHAPLGLRAAREYTKIAPSASHAQHMVSHIYTSLGRWDEVVEANITAVRVSEESMKRSGRNPALRSKHSLHWLQYALLQQGRFDEARDTLTIMRDDVIAVPEPHNRYHNALMRASYAVEDPLSPRVLSVSDVQGFALEDRAIDIFATAFVHIANDELDAARAELQRLQQQIDEEEIVSVEDGLHEDDSYTSEDGYLVSTIIARELEALLEYRAGNISTALQLLHSAVQDENTRPLEYGPPHVPKPTSELLGEMLLGQGRAAEAAQQFESSLQRNTGRTLSLLGLLRAQEATGDLAAAQTRQQLAAMWQNPDPGSLESQNYSWLNGNAAAAGGR